ncbi:Uncharacterised protein [Streptococcus pyogenes]|nr:histidine kinase [Streptococcus pyogenes]SQF59197.1 histidine kinase [Streptococcus pyogenes]SQH26240.1 histidine kinase [Streptococcus pyogenes]VGQ85646.1 histidine kinase [Streptococcus pyogenes]VGW22246.1 Uncharacterised protein [Streptococcus pyogenes]
MEVSSEVAVSASQPEELHRLPNRLIPEEDNNKLSRVAKEVVTEPRLNNPFLLPKKVLSLEDDAAILNHLEEDRNVNKLFLEPVAAEAKREINFHPSDQQVTAKVKESSDFHQKQYQTGITYGDDTLADLAHHLLHSDGVIPSLNDKSA